MASAGSERCRARPEVWRGLSWEAGADVELGQGLCVPARHRAGLSWGLVEAARRWTWTGAEIDVKLSYEDCAELSYKDCAELGLNRARFTFLSAADLVLWAWAASHQPSILSAHPHSQCQRERILPGRV